MSLPPEEPFSILTAREGSWNPFSEKVEAFAEAFDHFFPGDSEGRTGRILWIQIVDGEEMPSGTDSAGRGFHVRSSEFGLDGAKQGVLEHPVERLRNRLLQEITGLEENLPFPRTAAGLSDCRG